MAEKQTFSFTGVMIQDHESGGYTAYIAEFPEIIAQGGDIEEAKFNLFEALGAILQFRREEMKSEEDGDDNIITQSFNFALS